MKKLAMFMFAVLSAASVSASFNGNPAAPELSPGAGLFWCDPCSDWGIKIGYQRDEVSDRKLRNKQGLLSDVGRFEIHQDSGVLTLNWADKYEVYGLLGASSFEITENPFHFTTKDRLSWGVGGRGILWQCDCTTVGVNVNYQQVQPRSHHREGSTQTFSSSRWKYNEWQVGLGISQKVSYFVPYAAVTWSRARVKFHNFDDSHTKLDSRHKVGAALGVSFASCDWFDLTAEARVFSERAFTIAANVKF